MTQLELLLKVKYYLDNNNVPFWLQAGTLLGAYRNKDFISWDNKDIDIGLDYKYYWKVREILENNGFKFKAIWGKELCVIEHKVHLDLFFYTTDKDFTYCYAYKPNSFTNTWDIEWRMKYKKELFFPLSTIKFHNHSFYAPNNIKKYLQTQYGKNWSIPSKNWNFHEIPCKDNNYKQLAILIVTFLRDKSLQELVTSIENTFPKEWYRLYIADQGYYTSKKEEYYNKLKQKGHFITYLPFNCGLAFSRNYLINNIKEDLILLFDDDFVVTKKTKIQHFINILSQDKDIAMVGGVLHNSDSHKNLYLKNNSLYYLPVNENSYRYTKTTKIDKNPIKYYICDYILNFGLFKKEIFNDIKWDDDLKLGEHTDFYLRFKKLNQKCAWTDSVMITHNKNRKNLEYKNYRTKENLKVSKPLFQKKWKLTDQNIINLK